jgi:hypothetical protein
MGNCGYIDGEILAAYIVDWTLGSYSRQLHRLQRSVPNPVYCSARQEQWRHEMVCLSDFGDARTRWNHFTVRL